MQPRTDTRFDPEDPLDDDEERALALFAAADLLTGERCVGCERELCGHEAVLAVAMGFQDAARCLGCLAGGLGRERRELREDLLDHVARRDCFRQGWLRASEREGERGELRPRCLWGEAELAGSPRSTAIAPAPADDTGKHSAEPSAMHARESRGTPLFGSPVQSSPSLDDEWDAGDLACGELVLLLRQRLQSLAAGALLALRATDLAASQDIPAWCRITGHQLVRADPPQYWIRRREH